MHYRHAAQSDSLPIAAGNGQCQLSTLLNDTHNASQHCKWTNISMHAYMHQCYGSGCVRKEGLTMKSMYVFAMYAVSAGCIWHRSGEAVPGSSSSTATFPAAICADSAEGSNIGLQLSQHFTQVSLSVVTLPAALLHFFQRLMRCMHCCTALHARTHEI